MNQTGKQSLISKIETITVLRRSTGLNCDSLQISGGLRSGVSVTHDHCDGGEGGEDKNEVFKGLLI